MKYTTYFHSAVAALIFAGLSGNAISAQGEGTAETADCGQEPAADAIKDE
jgi:hypothetical protein